MTLKSDPWGLILGAFGPQDAPEWRAGAPHGAPEGVFGTSFGAPVFRTVFGWILVALWAPGGVVDG